MQHTKVLPLFIIKKILLLYSFREITICAHLAKSSNFYTLHVVLYYILLGFFFMLILF